MRAISVLSGLGYSALRALGIPALARRLQTGGLVLGYHNVVHERHTPVLGDPGTHLPRDRFATQMTWLARHYTVIPLAELVARLRDHRPLRGTVALTFDDGYDGVLAWGVPILRALELPATLFIVASAPDGGQPYWWDRVAMHGPISTAQREIYLDAMRGDGTTILASLDAGTLAPVPSMPRSAGWETIRAALGAGIDVGAHSVSHRTLTRCSDLELGQELHDSRTIIQQRTGIWPACFAYPYGRCDDRVAAAARDAGYDAAVTLTPGFVRAGDDPWRLKRLNIPARLGPAAYTCWLAGLRRASIA